jgi:hypothetical protein
MKNSKKGQLMDQAVTIIITLGFAAMLAGAFAIANAGFVTSITKANGNEVYNNSVGVLNNGSSGLLNMSVQLPVVGTVGGVALIIAVIVGALFASVGGILALKR